MAPVFFVPHVCKPPPTAELLGRDNGLRVQMRATLALGALLREGRLAPGPVLDLAVIAVSPLFIAVFMLVGPAV
jgi:hypothetical protein